MKKDVLEIKSNIPGPKVAVFFGVHGNEICGVNAVNNIINTIGIDKGSVIFVCANPKAVDQGVRFTDFNLNRAFRDINFYSDIEKLSFEYKRAQELKDVLSDVEILLDIHSSGTPESQPFIICEENAYNIVKYFPENFSKVVYGFDDIQPGGTDWYMNSVGKIGICVECGFHDDMEAVSLAEETIISYLKITGNINSQEDFDCSHKEFLKIYEMYITKTENFSLIKDFSDFEQLKIGQTIGIDGDKKITTDQDSIILFARSRQKIGSEGFLLAKLLN